MMRSLRSYFQVYGGGFFLAVIIMVVAYQFVEPAPPYSLTLATASPEGAYHGYGKQYKTYLAERGIELNLITTSGSVENLQLLKNVDVDAAFIQGGVGTSEQFPQLRGLASLYLEPLWIFTHKESRFSSIADFAGKRLAVGKEGSGTRAIAMQLLNDNGLDETEIEIVPLSASQVVSEVVQGEIDVAFMVTQAQSPQVRKLLNTPELHLLNLQRAKTYSRLHSYLQHVTLWEGVVDLQNNLPESDVEMVAPSATLVVSDELHPALIDQLMQVMQAVHSEGSLLSDATDFPSPENLDFPLSKEAERYYKNGPPFLQKYLPFWAATLIDRLKVMLLPLVALIIPLVKLLPPVYTWRVRSRIYRWYKELHDLEIELTDSGSEQVLAHLDQIEDEVRKVEVPLSYNRELYSLRLHINMLRQQLKESERRK